MIVPANNKTLLASITAIALFLILFGLATYLTSYLKGQISSHIFTISQSLAFGNQPVVIILLTIALILVGYINYIRGPSKLLLFRQFLLVLVYGLVISLLWVTTYYNKDDHYILAAIIFTSIVIYIITTCILYYLNSKTSKLGKSLLFVIPILTILILIGLVVSNIQKINKPVPELFPSLENSMLFMFLITILLQGML